MRAHVGSSLLLLSLAACGPELGESPPLQQLEPLESLPICGQPGPFQVLALDEDQTLVERESAVYRFEDRIYFLVGRAASTGSFDPHYIGREPSLHSTGPCGESPRLVADDVWELLEHPRWPGMLLGISDGDLVVIDPQSETEPRTLIENPHVHFGWSDHGILEVDEERGALVLRPYPSSPDDVEPEPTVLVEPFEDEAWGYWGDEVFFVQDGTLHRIDVLDDSRAVELDRGGNIEQLQLVGDGRFILWRTPEDDFGYRAIELYDRLLGISTPLGETDTHIERYDDYLVLMPRDLPDPSYRLVLLPSMERVDLPSFLYPAERIDDARWLVWRSPSSWLVYDRTTNATELLFDGQEELWQGETWFYEDRIEVLSPEWIASGFRRQGPVHAVWFDGRGKERIIDQATPGLHRLADGRFVTALDVYDYTHGRLALTGLDGVTRWEIDTEVAAWFGEYQAAAGLEDDVIVYAVNDGERSGVWLARLPAVE